MSMARNTINSLVALLLLVVAGVAGTGAAAADDGPDTPEGVRLRIEAQPWPVLERGKTHWRVFAVKKLLGVPTGTNGTVYDAALNRAVTAYQKRKDLAERDRVGTETWESLRYDFGVAVPGSTGPKVFAVQIALRNNGYPSVALDGIYGAKTQNRVRLFQKKVGIGVDGKVGRLTFRALICKGT